MLRIVLCERLKQSSNTLPILEKCWVIFFQLLQVANHYAHAIKGVNKSSTDVKTLAIKVIKLCKISHIQSSNCL